jgi:hypothetical protein
MFQWKIRESLLKKTQTKAIFTEMEISHFSDLNFKWQSWYIDFEINDNM